MDTLSGSIERILLHELVHHFDINYYGRHRNMTDHIYYGDVYDGLFSMWFIEGSAEYYSHGYYDPDHNHETILEEIHYQNPETFGEMAAMDTDQFVSFADAVNPERINYGVYYALYWYLMEEFGEVLLADYLEAQNETSSFDNSLAEEYLNASEGEIMRDWHDLFFND